MNINEKKETRMNCSTKTITPDDALAIIGGHENYRRLSSGRVSAYQKAMIDGTWGLSILIFSESGELVDGQTRLNAVIKSGKPQKFISLYGWPEDQICNIDGGQNRSRSQVAKAERGIKNANKIMAVVCGIEMICEQSRVIINSESITLYDKYGELAEDLFAIVSPSSSLGAAIHIIPFARAIITMPEKEYEIKEALRKTVDLDFSENRMSGLRLYYRWAIERGFSRGGGSVRRDAYLRCCRAILAYLNEQKIDKLFAKKTDPFPYEPEVKR